MQLACFGGGPECTKLQQVDERRVQLVAEATLAYVWLASAS